MSLTASEISAMRDTMEDWLPSTCTIQIKTVTAGAMGGITSSYANTYTSVPCRVDPGITGSSGSDELIRNFALEGKSIWLFNVAYDQALDIEDRVVYDGITYEIRGVIDNQSYNLNRQAVMVRVN